MLVTILPAVRKWCRSRDLGPKAFSIGTTSEGGIASGGIGGVCTLDPLQPGCGVIFELSPTGTEKVLYRFKGKADGALPSSGLVLDAQGNLYGTTYEGGSPNCQYGCVVVFKLTP
jgi:hypothetical protein